MRQPSYFPFKKISPYFHENYKIFFTIRRKKRFSVTIFEDEVYKTIEKEFFHNTPFVIIVLTFILDLLLIIFCLY